MKIILILLLEIASNKKADISKHSLQWYQETKNHNAKLQHLRAENAGKTRGRLKEVLQRDVHKKDPGKAQTQGFRYCGRLRLSPAESSKPR